jgi:hypothetical protein
MRHEFPIIVVMSRIVQIVILTTVYPTYIQPTIELKLILGEGIKQVTKWNVCTREC